MQRYLSDVLLSIMAETSKYLWYSPIKFGIVVDTPQYLWYFFGFLSNNPL